MSISANQLSSPQPPSIDRDYAFPLIAGFPAPVQLSIIAMKLIGALKKSVDGSVGECCARVVVLGMRSALSSRRVAIDCEWMEFSLFF